MRSTKSPSTRNARVRLQIDADKLAELIQTRSIRATDFSCLDHQSKSTIKKLFLHACLKEFVE